MEGGGVWLASNKIEGFRKDERLAFLDDILDPESTWVLGFAHTQEKVWTRLLSAAILATAEHVCDRGGYHWSTSRPGCVWPRQHVPLPPMPGTVAPKRPRAASTY